MEQHLIDEDEAVYRCPFINPSKKTKLSWPRDGDSRRSIVADGPRPEAIANMGPIYSSRMVHVTDRDVARHYQKPGPASALPTSNPKLALQMPMPFDSQYQVVEEQALVEYFQNIASRALSTFGTNPKSLGQALVRIAHLDKSITSQALVKLIMTFAFVHKYGVHVQMMELKIAALHDLSQGSSPDQCPIAATQHLAAGMLLCAIEIHQSSCTTGQWLIYLSGAKNVVQSGILPDTEPGSDLAMLLDWLYYFDVLARFSFQHWRGPCTIEKDPKSALFDPGFVRAERPSTANGSMALIELLSEVSDATSVGLPTTATREEKENHLSYLKILEWRIQNTAVASECETHDPETRQIMELFKMAMLIYLNRANEHILGPNPKTEKMVERGFALLSSLAYCDRQFPVFIFGCEARSDEQRAAILDVVARTENGVPSRGFNYVRLILPAMWSQDDLANEPLEYWIKVFQVLKRCDNLPTFV